MSSNMLSEYIVLLVIASVYLNSAEGKFFNNCELAKTLLNNGVPRGQIATYVCIAQHESNYNTKAVNGNTGDYGIFQISHLYWCNDGNTPGKACHITCNSLLDDDITNDIKCARLVYSETKNQSGCGFCAWVTYKNYCSGGRSDKYINGCNI